MSNVVLEPLGKIAEEDAAPSAKSSLMTPIGIVEGEVLTYLEHRQSSTLEQLTRELPRPSALTLMGVGSLIRSGLVRAIQDGLDIILKPRKPLPAHVIEADPAPSRRPAGWEHRTNPISLEEPCVAQHAPSPSSCSSPSLEPDAQAAPRPS